MERMRREPVKSSTVVTYTSLILLLLAFFIMLNGLGRVEESRLEAAYQSLKGAFGFEEGVVGPFGTGILPVEGVGPISPAEGDYLVLRGLARQESLDASVRFLRAGPERTVVMSAELLFIPGGVQLSPQGREYLTRAAGVIKEGEYPLAIHGHTDDAPPAPGLPDNLTLSAQRALSVLRFLVSQGVSPRRLSAQGLAGHKPLVPNTSPRYRAMNNRVELVLDAREAAQHRLGDQPGPRQMDFRGFTFDLTPPPEGR